MIYLFTLLVLVSAGHLAQWWFQFWVEKRVKNLETAFEIHVRNYCAKDSE